MKYFITLFLLLFAVSARTQITLEHVYSSGSISAATSLGLVQVDSGLWKYILYDRRDTIFIFNLDHSLDHSIHLPWNDPYPPCGFSLKVIAKRLFDLDDAYEFMGVVCSDSQGIGGLRLFKENGQILFACDSCSLYTSQFSGWSFGSPIKSTDSGTKMFVNRSTASTTRLEVYSLPGKLPSGTQKLGIINASSSFADGIAPGSAYPNPASGRVRIAYDLPQGVTSGYMTLTSEDGREMKRYHVTNAFSDLLIEASDLPSGSYFYKLVTDKGESPAQRIVWMR